MLNRIRNSIHSSCQKKIRLSLLIENRQLKVVATTETEYNLLPEAFVVTKSCEVKSNASWKCYIF
jgi:hypothetical protein